jgi:hypothetical protein
MWHCNVKASSLLDTQGSFESARKCLKIGKESSNEGARGVQTLYMTGRMRKVNKPAKAMLQALGFQALD